MVIPQQVLIEYSVIDSSVIDGIRVLTSFPKELFGGLLRGISEDGLLWRICKERLFG
ncbi:hypothetical protein LguiB_027111 [Lonicera macranthoides]